MSDFTLGALSAEFQGLVKMLESADEVSSALCGVDTQSMLGNGTGLRVHFISAN